MTDTAVKVSNSQLSKNSDYKVLVEDILGSNCQVVRLNTAPAGSIQYWDGNLGSDSIVTVNAGQSWVEALWVGDSILSNTSAMLALVDDGTSHAAALVQPTTPADTQPISGSVTANAGTNLNTSALALESGGNLEALLVELQVLNGAYPMRSDVASATVTYQAWAAPGTATSAASWRIRRITESSGDYTIELADGNANFDNIYDNRAALSYS